ncbi:(2Fe-2S)-binding protein [Aliamphritea spongicola]
MQTDANLHITRLSCCMHYRRHDGELCTNCPRPTPLSAA